MVAKLRRKELTKEEDRSWKSHAKARNWNRSERERIRKSVLRLKSFSKGIGPDIRQKGARGDWVTILGQGAYNPKEDLRAQRSHLTRKGKEDRTRQRQGTLGIPRENRNKDSAFPHSHLLRFGLVKIELVWLRRGNMAIWDSDSFVGKAFRSASEALNESLS